MIEKCSKCGKKVEYELEGMVFPGGKDREEAICPYCGNVLASKMTSQVFNVRGLEDDEQLEVSRWN